jgi:acid-sensing ion channel, other
MISFAKKLSPIFEIPFPAVTICTNTKASINAINITDSLTKDKLLSDNEKEILSTLAHVCDFEHEMNDSNLNRSLIEILNDVAYSSHEIFHACQYGLSSNDNCENFFHKIITDEGVCYTFNMLDQSDLWNNETITKELKFPNHGKKSSWFLEKDYDSMKVKIYPRRIIGAGLKSGLSIKIGVNSSFYNPGCKFAQNGFRLAVHMPVNYPQFSKNFYNIQFGQQTTIIIKPQMIYSSKDIREYSPESRQCYFNDERNLTFFKVYTQDNCNLECESKFIYEKCGCVQFWMPRGDNMSICALNQLKCVQEVLENFSTQELELKLIEKQLKRDLKHGKANKNDERFKILKELSKNNCNCLPTCNMINYEAEIDRINYDIVDDGLEMLILYLNLSNFTF